MKFIMTNVFEFQKRHRDIYFDSAQSSKEIAVKVAESLEREMKSPKIQTFVIYDRDTERYYVYYEYI